MRLQEQVSPALASMISEPGIREIEESVQDRGRLPQGESANWDGASCLLRLAASAEETGGRRSARIGSPSFRRQVG